MTKWAALFDVDGTMVDNVEYHERAWFVFAERHSLTLTREYYQNEMHSKTNLVILRKLFGEDPSDEELATLAEEKEAVYREIYAPHMREIPGLTALLVDLHEADVPLKRVNR